MIWLYKVSWFLLNWGFVCWSWLLFTKLVSGNTFQQIFLRSIYFYWRKSKFTSACNSLVWEKNTPFKQHSDALFEFLICCSALVSSISIHPLNGIWYSAACELCWNDQHLNSLGSRQFESYYCLLLWPLVSMSECVMSVCIKSALWLPFHLVFWFSK